MDSIVVMEDGKVLEQGSPQALLRQVGDNGIGESRYRSLMRINGEDILEETLASLVRAD